MEKKDGQTVFVGVSGGVDSSVAALELIDAGYRVEGAFIYIAQPDFPECASAEDRVSAMRVCATLGIPYREVDLSEAYRKNVIERLKAAYARGETPNPDVWCNEYIKFDAFFNWAMEAGADFVATGHYARVEKVGGQYRLLCAEDADKDQTYFLWALSQSVLEKTLFPIGGMKKRDVRRRAAARNLPTASRPDSQGLCFLGDVSLKDFLVRELSPEPGIVENEAGEAIGTHPGSVLFTLGERHGFFVTDERYQGAPLYVVARDVARNTLVVAKEPHIKDADDSISITSASWIAEKPESGREYEARIRHQGARHPVTLSLTDGGRTARVSFLKERPLAAAGQSLVLYDGTQCLGGGVIQP